MKETALKNLTPSQLISQSEKPLAYTTQLFNVKCNKCGEVVPFTVAVLTGTKM